MENKKPAYEEFIEKRDREMKRIDLLNLKNDELYRYKIVEGIHVLNRTVVAEGEVEAVNSQDAYEVVKNKYDGKIDFTENDIYIYEWIPETVEYEGLWELVDSYSRDTVADHDLKQIEGKRIRAAEMRYEGGRAFLCLTFDDHTRIDIEDVRYKDWFIYPF